MRLTLDPTTGHLYDLRVAPATPLECLDVPLGSQSLEIYLEGSAVAQKLVPLIVPEGVDVPAELEFAANPSPAGVTDFSGANALNGSTTVTSVPVVVAPQVLSCSEDWYTIVLVALFAATPNARYVELTGQYRWRNGAEVETERWHYSQLVKIRVLNTVLPSVFIPGALQVGGNLYFPSVTDYTGGAANDLDAVPTAALPLGTVLRFIHPENGESVWVVRAGTAVTDQAGGVIRPTDYHATTNAKNLIRAAGF